MPKALGTEFLSTSPPTPARHPATAARVTPHTHRSLGRSRLRALLHDFSVHQQSVSRLQRGNKARHSSTLGQTWPILCNLLIILS